MWKRIALVGASAAIIGGAGTAAFAANGTTTPTPTPSSSSATSDTSSSSATSDTSSKPEAGTTPAGKHAGLDRLRRAVHATWVTENKKTGTFTTHDAIRGLVTAVSPTSITVRAADSTTETYAINAGTKVFTRAPRAASGVAAPKTRVPRTAATISDVKTGDPVFVGGTGTTALTALRVIDVKK